MFSLPIDWLSHLHKIYDQQVFQVCIQLYYEPIKCHCCPHIETSQLICSANQLTRFYMRATLALNGLILFHLAHNLML